MGVTVYYSTDAGAPVLYGAAGYLKTLLKTCLVGTDGIAYGSKPSKGWTTDGFEDVGNNVIALRPPSGNRHYLWLNDNLQQYANVRAWETITSLNGTSDPTGTYQYPTAAQQTTYCIKKSGTNDSTTARPWTLIADDYCFYLLPQAANVPTDVCGSFFFGDIISYKVDDVGHCMIAGITSNSNNINYANAALEGSIHKCVTAGIATAGVWLARRYDNVTGGVTAGMIGDYFCAGDMRAYGQSSSGYYAYPNTVDSSLLTSSINVIEGSPSYMRGVLPGMYHPLHTVPFVHKTVIEHPIGMSNRNLQAFKTSGWNGLADGMVLFDITGPWR